MRDSSYLSRPCCAAGAGLRVPALLLCQHETPRFFRPLPCICNTDTRCPHDTVRSDLTVSILYPKPDILRKSFSIKVFIYFERFREPRRPCDSFDAANQDRCGILLLAAHDVEHPMHAVREIYIYRSRLTKHRRIADSLSAACMRSFVVKTIVGLHFGDHERHRSAVNTAH